MNIVAKNLAKRFNREWIFRNLNYQFQGGNTYAIVGPNGSGKSTLMQVLWGQMMPSSGSIDYDGIDQSEIYKAVSIATPYMELIEEFTLDEMIHFHFKFKKSRLPLETIVNASGLRAARSKVISTFSSGMRQRLKLTLAFHADTKAIFLDEPCTNLDKKAIDWYQGQLAQMPTDVVVFIASNQDYEYPKTASTIDIMSYK